MPQYAEIADPVTRVVTITAAPSRAAAAVRFFPRFRIIVDGILADGVGSTVASVVRARALALVAAGSAAVAIAAMRCIRALSAATNGMAVTSLTPARRRIFSLASVAAATVVVGLKRARATAMAAAGAASISISAKRRRNYVAASAGAAVQSARIWPYRDRILSDGTQRSLSTGADRACAA
jgi:hypothetical protein